MMIKHLFFLSHQPGNTATHIVHIFRTAASWGEHCGEPQRAPPLQTKIGRSRPASSNHSCSRDHFCQRGDTRPVFGRRPSSGYVEKNTGALSSEPPMTQVSTQEHFLFPGCTGKSKRIARRGVSRHQPRPPVKQILIATKASMIFPSRKPKMGSRREHQAVWTHIQAALMVPSQPQHTEGHNRRH